MKKVLLLLFALLATSNVFAEKKVSEYNSSYFKKKYDIESTDVKNGSFTYYIYCESKDSYHKTVGFSLESSEIPNFVKNLQAIKEKFAEWTQVAKDNNVTDYDKTFDVSFKSVHCFFLYGKDWHFTSTRFTPYFKVTKDSEYLVVFNVGELTASDNRYMDIDGFFIVFQDGNEIDEFIQAIDPSHALEVSDTRSKKDALFE